MFKYKMVQVLPNISVDMKNHTGSEAAVYLENVVNEYAEDGWEFHRIDRIGVELQPGCFAALRGQKAETNIYYVITFRMEV
ncbi:DUF4177 domain-containing protein [Vibrio sp. RE88]|uniref:DUF4177 domain-containing protein n=1 Tax=Vibrio sp. RE88 TaxID=2607610 RepID=UPI0014937069|nr:DUF4177 domain-containing protein [Vibrio sp. RE88]NOH61126.1 DUF4177 domain-containing protein [Vibrio sp. RE88]